MGLSHPAPPFYRGKAPALLLIVTATNNQAVLLGKMLGLQSENFFVNYRGYTTFKIDAYGCPNQSG